jgi:chemotaxis signal transduction protein
MTASASIAMQAQTLPRYAIDIGLADVAVVFAQSILLELPYGANRCPLPGAPAWWRGAINHRGFVVPRFDIARWLNRQDGRELIEVIVDSAPHSTAWLLPAAPELLQLHSPGLRPMPDVVPLPLQSYVSEVWMSDSGEVIELNHRRLLAELGRSVQR